MSATNNLRFRQSIGVISKANSVEFFRANIRESLILKMDSNKILELLHSFNGNNSLKDICNKMNFIDLGQLETLSNFLKEEFILIEQDLPYSLSLTKDNYRLINILEDYFHSTSEVINAIENLKKSKVMIIGVGAVGSYIATYLAKVKVGKFIFVDSDTVDISNLHRQYYFEKDIGEKKADVLAEHLKKIDKNIEIKTIHNLLDDNFFKLNSLDEDIDLIINCADQPSVDYTSRLVAKYAMKNNIPHIVGGGYNLHLTLIGQTIIPNLTACFKCFEKALHEKNLIDLKGIKKLHREGRKLGSYPPLSGLASTLAALDAFKVLIKKYEYLQQSNRRIEFSIEKNNFTIREIPKDPNCEWCGVS